MGRKKRISIQHGEKTKESFPLECLLLLVCFGFNEEKSPRNRSSGGTYT